MKTTEAKNYAYSFDEESYSDGFATPEEAAMEALHDCDDDALRVHVGEAVKPRPEDYVDARDVIEGIIESHEEIFGGDWTQVWVEGILEWSRKDRFNDLTETISKAIGEWLDKHDLRPTFYNVENIETWVRDGLGVKRLEAKPQTVTEFAASEALFTGPEMQHGKPAGEAK